MRVINMFVPMDLFSQTDWLLVSCFASGYENIGFSDGLFWKCHKINLFERSWIEKLQRFQVVLFLDFFTLAKYFPVKSHEKIFGIFHATREIIRMKLREQALTIDPQKPAGNFIKVLSHSQREAIEENKEEMVSVSSEDHLRDTRHV